MGLLTDIIEKHIDDKHAQEDDLKRSKRQLYSGIVFDTSGKYNDEQKEYAQKQLGSLLNPEAKKSFLGKAVPLFQRLTHIANGVNGQQPSPANALPTPATPAPVSDVTLATPPGGGAMTTQPQPSSLPTPKTPVPQSSQAALPPFMTDADIEKRRVAPQQAERDRRKKQGAEEFGLTGRDLATYTEHGTLPAQTRTGNAKPEQWKLQDGTVVDVDFDPVTRQRFFGGEDWDIPEGATRVQKTSIARPTIIANDYVTLADAGKLAAQGLPFNGDDGKPLDLTKIPAGMVLQKVHYADGRTLYQPRNISDKVVTVGNHVYAVNPAEVQTIPQGGGTDLGLARTGSQNTPTSVERDANGNFIAVTGSTSTPNSPGAGRPAPSAAAPQSAPSVVPSAAPTRPTPNPATTPSPRGQAALAPPAPTAGRRSVGVTPAMDKQFMDLARPIREATTQVLGDPANPELKTLKDLGPEVLKDPKSVKRVGTAISMMFNQAAGGLGGAHVGAGASAGPVSINVGGFGDYLANSLNVPKATAEKINENLQNAMKDMSPAERAAVASTMKAFEASVAMRSLTKAGVSDASIAAIQKTLPLIGVNTFTMDDFANRMQSWAEDGLNGSWGIPPQYLGKGMIDRLHQISSEMTALKNQSGPSPRGKAALAPPGRGGSSAPKTADDYLKQLVQ